MNLKGGRWREDSISSKRLDSEDFYLDVKLNGLVGGLTSAPSFRTE